MTGYVVHYSDGDTDRNESVPASSTSSLITGLTINITYNFTVEATSEHISGKSTVYTVILGMLKTLRCKTLSFRYGLLMHACLMHA